MRAAAVSVFESISYETARHHVSLKVLKQLGERCTDKKASRFWRSISQPCMNPDPNFAHPQSSIRAIAFKALGRLYSLAFSEM